MKVTMKNQNVVQTSQEKPEISARDIPSFMPILPLRDIVIFPYMIFPVLIGRESSIKAVNEAIDKEKYILLLTQRDPGDDEPTKETLYHEGTIAKILQVLKLPNGLMKVLVDGVFQAKVTDFINYDQFLGANVRVIEFLDPTGTEFRALVRQLIALFNEYIRLNRNIPTETLIAFENINEPMRKLYYAAANIIVSVDAKQNLLRLEDSFKLYYEIITLLTNEIDILKIEQEIDNKVHTNIQKSQRKFFLQEQIRILQSELGEDEELSPELSQLKSAIEKSGMPTDVEEKTMEEFRKLTKTSSLSPDFTVSRNYIDWLVALPWKIHSDDNLDINNAKQVLDEDHYGLEKPKERILEHIAVLNLVKEMKGPILCFVGPPGVGKTSLGKSIARALGRKLVRVSLGGVRDEAEIRGHRRTYVGSMPGKIIQSMRKAGTNNPVMLLDEVDKMSMDFRGDPSAAMLEVLDPEQNHSFNDHYLDVDFDLSKVLFITTANVRYNIPPPLLDRMEVIELPGYLEHEKVEISKRHLIPKQIQAHGLKDYKIRFKDSSIVKVIREYTQEAGVRNVEREIANICRKIARNVVMKVSEEKDRGKKINHKKSQSISVIFPDDVEKYLGVPKFRERRAQKIGKIGSVTGLAWTSIGGDLLQVDVSIMPGPEKLTLTGQLGDVMKESAQAALSFIRSHTEEFGLESNFHEKKEIHIHLPEGAIPKDGPSAGITMALAILSAIKKIPARGDVAMTGEITLRGEVLAIGGLNEKLLAARRHRIKYVIIPKDNERNLSEIPDSVKKGLKLIPVSSLMEAIPLVFSNKIRVNKK